MSPVNLTENDYYTIHGVSSFVNQELHKQNNTDYALCSENNVRKNLSFRLDKQRNTVSSDGKKMAQGISNKLFYY